MLDYKKLKQLREETGVSFSLCKKALEETNNDIAASKKKLNEWGVAKAKSKEDRVTGEGGIFSYTHHNKKVAAFVELQTETDFVAKTPEFQKLGGEIAMQVASLRPLNVEELLKQEYIRDTSKTIENLIKEAILKFGENIKIGRFLRWELGRE